MRKRILIFSDSHGQVERLEEAIRHALKSGGAEMAVFLGDGEADLDAVRPLLAAAHIEVLQVRGNRDWLGTAPLSIEFEVNGARFYATHGAAENVKYGLQKLWYTARERNADAALYGHTHQAKIDLEQGILLFNPGSVGYDAAYGEIIVEENGLLKPSLVLWK